MSMMSKFMKMPVEYYLVIFLFLVVIFMSTSTAGEPLPFHFDTSLTPYSYEGFRSDFPEKVHAAANVNGQESSAVLGNKGVLGIFEAEGLKAAPVEAPGLYDPVSKLSGAPECVGQSVYSNSKGGLCLTDDIRNAFNSRGGNRGD